jgi:beta-phosphoglucomutase-like phosphatase (HAD superfamily)
MTPVRAVAFDVDGTLVDSEPLHLQALQAVCQAHGVDISDHGSTPFVGVAIADVWRDLAPRFERALGHHPDQGEQVFRSAVTRHYLTRIHEVQVLPGARDALAHLQRQGIALAAVSNSERAIVEANLRAVGAAEAFGAVVSLDDVRNPKPAPEPYTRAMALLGMPAAAERNRPARPACECWSSAAICGRRQNIGCRGWRSLCPGGPPSSRTATRLHANPRGWPQQE